MTDRPTPNPPAWVHGIKGLHPDQQVFAEIAAAFVRSHERLVTAMDVERDMLAYARRLRQVEQRGMDIDDRLAALEAAATPVCAPVAAATGADGCECHNGTDAADTAKVTESAEPSETAQQKARRLFGSWLHLTREEINWLFGQVLTVDAGPRCSDCRWWARYQIENGNGWCGAGPDRTTHEGFYCAAFEAER